MHIRQLVRNKKMTIAYPAVLDGNVRVTSVRRMRSRKGPFLFINAMTDLPENFQEIVSIDDIDYLTQAVSLAALFNGAIDNTTGRFDQGKARTLIADFNASLPESDR